MPKVVTIHCPLLIRQSLRSPEEVNLCDGENNIVARIRGQDAGYIQALVVLVNSVAMKEKAKQEVNNSNKTKNGKLTTARTIEDE